MGWGGWGGGSCAGADTSGAGGETMNIACRWPFCAATWVDYSEESHPMV